MNVTQAFVRMRHCRDLAAFYRRWSATEAAGLPLGSALSGLSDDSASVVASRVDHIRDLLQHGSIDIQVGFDGFTVVEVAFINVGRESGNLDGAPVVWLTSLRRTTGLSCARAEDDSPSWWVSCVLDSHPTARIPGGPLVLANQRCITLWCGLLARWCLLWRYFTPPQQPRVAQVRFFGPWPPRLRRA